MHPPQHENGTSSTFRNSYKSANGNLTTTEISVKKSAYALVNVCGENLRRAVWGEDTEELKPHRWLKPLAESVCNHHRNRSCILIGLSCYHQRRKPGWSPCALTTPALKSSDDAEPSFHSNFILLDRFKRWTMMNDSADERYDLFLEVPNVLFAIDSV